MGGVYGGRVRGNRPGKLLRSEWLEARLDTRTHARTHARTHTHTHSVTHSHTHAHTHTHRQTHTQPLKVVWWSPLISSLGGVY